MRTIALTGGGTAGHIMPNLALLSELRKHFDRVIYIGAGGMEEELSHKLGLRFFKTEVVRLERTDILKNLKIPFALYRAVNEAKKILIDEKVDCVFSKGGYAALPAALAAKRLGRPIVCHESDYSMGVANKLTARFATGTITSFPETKGGTFIGNPIREEVFSGNPKRVIEELKLANKPTVLIVGGSLGAEALNLAVWSVLAELTAHYNILHVAGKGYDPTVCAENYHAFPMTDRLPDLFAAADIVVTRAGANTLSELAALGKRTIAVPLPKGASRGDQMENAASFERRGLLTILEQQNLNGKSLLLALEKGLEAKEPKAQGRGAVNRKIVAFILEKCNKRAMS